MGEVGTSLAFNCCRLSSTLVGQLKSHITVSLKKTLFYIETDSVVAGPSLQRCGFSADSIGQRCETEHCLVLCYRTFPHGRPQCPASAGTVLRQVNAPLSALHEWLIFKTVVTGSMTVWSL